MHVLMLLKRARCGFYHHQPEISNESQTAGTPNSASSNLHSMAKDICYINTVVFVVRNSTSEGQYH